MSRPFRLPDDPKRAGDDVESEIRLHLELRAREFEASGMAPDEAREAAIASFGDREAVARECASVRGDSLRARRRSAWLAELRLDLRSALRGLARAPGFTLVAALTLTLGIGANTALFTVARSVLFRPLPYPESDRLVQIWTDERAKGREDPEWLTPPDFDDWRAQNGTFVAMSAYQGWGPDLTGDGDPISLAGLAVTRGFFDVLGVRPALGRLFVDADDDPGAERVAVVTDALWRLRFGADPALLGRSITLNGEPWTVVGILPASFRAPVAFPPEIYRPARRPLDSGCGRDCIVLRAIGRMRAGVTLAQAEADLDAIAGRLADAFPDSNRGRGAWLVGLHEQLTGPVRPALAMLGGAALFVLLVGCVNLATLLLVRGAARRRELAMRAALGAGQSRLVRQLLTEGLVLAGLGGALGLGIAWLAGGALARLVPPSVSQVQAVGVDGAVVGFAMLLTLASAGLFAAAPAFHAVRRNLFATLRATDQGDEAGSRRLRSALVIAELALAVMLLVGAGLMLRSLLRLGRIDLGFRTEGLVTVPVRFPPARYAEPARALAAIEDVAGRLRDAPALRAVAYTDAPPLQPGGDQDVGLAAIGEPPPEGSRSIWYRLVSPNYLDVMGMRIVAGRGFGPADRAGAGLVGIVNQETARRYWRGKDPIGREMGGDGIRIVVVGVVANGHHDGPNQPVKTELFVPIGQLPTRGVTFVLDPAADEASAVAALRAGLGAVDPLIPLGPAQTLARQLDATVAQPRLYTGLVAALAAVALGLAALGVFGVMAYSVALRRREIGVRLALGAGPSAIHALVLRDGLRLALLGGAAGLIGAGALSHLLSALLFDVSALDPLAFAGAALTLGLVALAAAWVPARRAMRVDPLVATRAD